MYDQKVEGDYRPQINASYNLYTHDVVRTTENEIPNTSKIIVTDIFALSIYPRPKAGKGIPRCNIPSVKLMSSGTNTHTN